MGIINLQKQAAPVQPTGGYASLYVDTADNVLKYKDENNFVHQAQGVDFIGTTAEIATHRGNIGNIEGKLYYDTTLDVLQTDDGTATLITVNYNLADDSVTYAKIQNVVADNVLLGNNSGAGGIVDELTGTEATALLDNFTSTEKGLAPLSGGGTTNYLRADGTWDAPPGGSSTLDGLTDTTITAPADGEFLVYDNGTSKWINGTAPLPPSLVEKGYYQKVAPAIEVVDLVTEANAVLHGTNVFHSASSGGSQPAVGSTTRQVQCYCLAGATTTSDYFEYATAASQGDFGVMTVSSTGYAASAGDTTRGLIYYGSAADTSTVRYLTFANTSSHATWGNMGTAQRNLRGGANSKTRAVVGGGFSGGASTALEYMTMQSFGAAAGFASLAISGFNRCSGSNEVLGYWCGGVNNVSRMESIVIANQAQASIFVGNMSQNRDNGICLAGQTKMLVFGGAAGTTIDKITIGTTANAALYGGLSTGNGTIPDVGQTSSHGGLTI